MELGFRTYDMTALIFIADIEGKSSLSPTRGSWRAATSTRQRRLIWDRIFTVSEAARGKELTTLRTSSGYGERCVEADAASPTDNALGESVVVFRMSEKLRLQKSHQSRSQQERVSLHPPVVISHPIITVGGDLTEGVNSNPAKNTNGAALQCPGRAGNQ
jgi:hypothetical protein